jgi:Zn-dependent protease
MIFGLPIDLLLMRATALLVVVAAHGYAVAFVADRLGDGRPRAERRLTPNALRHLDPLGVPAFVFSGGYGWIRQVMVETGRLRFGRASLILVVLAGASAALLLAWAALLLRLPIADAAGWETVADMLEVIASTGIAFALFNILPLPPLTGGLLLAVVAPRLYLWFAERALLPALLIALLLAAGTIQAWLDPSVARILAVLPG